MKRLLILSALGIALFTTWGLVATEPACAMPGFCGPGGQTLPAWGMASTCQGAIDQAINLAANQIPGDCDVCGVFPIEVTPCHQCGEDPNDPEACTAANQWRADYKVRYRCEVDLGDLPM